MNKIVWHISFIVDTDFKATHPGGIIDIKCYFLDEDKFSSDVSTLVIVLEYFFSLHSDNYLDTFLGNSGFHQVDLYDSLINYFHLLEF